MTEQTIVALAGIGGTLLGTLLTSAIAAFIHIRTKKLETKHTLTLSRIDRREELFTEFLHESNRLLVKSVTEEVTPAEEMTELFGMLQQMRLLSTELGDDALEFVDSIVEAHNTRNKDNDNEDEEGRQKRLDALKDRREKFVEHCRKELDRLEREI